jgi:hypothetical protein
MDETRERRGHFAHGLGVAVTAYFIPFIALLFDEFVFETRLNRLFTPELDAFIRVVYAPLFSVFDHWFY